MVPGEAIQVHYEDKEVGETEAIQGTMDGHPYTIWGMKEPDYVMSMMAMGGLLNEDKNCRLTRQTWAEKGEKKTKVSCTSFLFTGISGIVMLLMTTITTATKSHPLKRHGKHTDGRTASSLSSSQSPR
jgi:hypothetical protein